MYLEPNIEPSFWNRAEHDHWLATNFNNSLNSILKPFKVWTGRLGILMVAIFGSILVVPLYFFVRYYNKKAIRKIQKANEEFIDSIFDKNGELNKSEWRKVSKKQLELARVIKEFNKERQDRRVASGFVMNKFLKQESILISSLESANTELRKKLYPNVSRTYTQEELEKMAASNLVQDDLDNSELDSSLEKYLM